MKFVVIRVSEGGEKEEKELKEENESNGRTIDTTLMITMMKTGEGEKEKKIDKKKTWKKKTIIIFIDKFYRAKIYL